MENAKKLLLVDPSRATQLYRPTITDKKLGSLDRDMADVLNSDLPDDEKSKRYLMILKTYRKFDTNEQPKADPDLDILNSVPSNVRIKAKRLLKHIKPHVRWSDEGEIANRGSLVPYSNISELLTETVSETSGRKRPIGWEEFADTLKRSKAPKDLISNQQLWTYMTPKTRRTARRRGFIED
jgi:hypothetical protein